MKTSSQSVVLLLFALIGTPSANALIVFDYSAAANERFQAGTFPNNPTANSSFFLKNYDLSGVGWQTSASSLAVTMVSPQNFLSARHVAPVVGAAVSFLGRDGLLRSYTVSAVSAIEYSPGVASDLVVGTLTGPVNAQIGFFPSLYLGTNLASYTGLKVGVYGAGGRMGLNSITGFETADFIPQDGNTDNLFAVMHYDAISGGTAAAPAATQAQSGDSSSPSFAFVGGNLALIGLHSAIDSTPIPEYTYDAFVPRYLDDIDAVLQGSGYNMTYYTEIPEPASIALWSGLAAGTALIRRRLRRPISAI